MGFGCPICSERLERLPAEAAQRAGADKRNEDDVNIAATPCGHLFHTYCIQKWLAGSIASSKQCPCCRKPVPNFRILPLFPNGYEESMLEDPSSQGAAECDHTNFNITISTLRKQLSECLTKQKETEDILAVQSHSAADFKQKYDSEKAKSDHYLIQWKQCESYKDLARQKERECLEMESNLKKFSIINSIIKGLNDPVENELRSFPPTVDSVRTLIQMIEVLKDEIESISKKLDDCKREQESTRLSKAKLQSNYEKLIKDYKELKKVYEECKSSPGFSPDRSHLNNQDLNQLMEDNQTRTPLFKTTKQTRKGLINFDGYEIDNDVPLIQSFGAKPKKRNATANSIPLSQSSKSSSSSVEVLATGGMKVLSKNPSKTMDRQKPESQSSSSSILEMYGRPPAKKFAFSKKTSTVTSGQFDCESVAGRSQQEGKYEAAPVIRKVSKLINCDVSPISPRMDETINLSSDEDEDISQLPLRGNIPGLPVTPLRRRSGMVINSRRAAVPKPLGRTVLKKSTARARL